MLPLLCSDQQSFLKNAVITASNEDVGFEVDAVSDGDPTTVWKSTGVASVRIEADLGSAQAIDYWGLYGWSTPNDGQVQFEVSDDGLAWTPVGSVSPDSTRPLNEAFDELTHRYVAWEYTGNSTNTFTTNILMVGKRIEFEYGIPAPYTPIDDAEEFENLTNHGDGGIPLGTIMKARGAMTSPGFIRMTRGFWTEQLRPALQAGGIYLFSWFPDNYPDSVGLVTIPGKIPKPSLDINHRYSITIPMRGVVR